MSPASGTPGIVYVVDDDLAFLKAIGRVITAAGHTARLYSSAPDYLSADNSEGPACVLLDLRMPGLSGLDLQSALERRKDAHPVIFLSAYGDIPTTVRAMRGGALDFLTKPVTTAELLKMVRRALDRDEEGRQSRARLAEVRERFATLTPRERQVMAGVVAGRLNKQICYALQLAERTVKTHRARVMEKMSVRSVAELVRLTQQLAEDGVTLESTCFE